MSLATDLALVVVGGGALWYGAERFVESAVALARRFGLSDVVTGVAVVGIGTSAPEVAVSADAALTGAPDIAVGNVVGSNFFNLGLILGAVALLGRVRVRGQLLRRDGVALLLATLAVLGLLFDRRLGRLEAALLLVGLAVYLLVLLRRTGQTTPIPGEAVDADPGDRPLLVALGLLGGLALVLLGADVLVRGASALALDAGVSEWAVGITVVAAGTSSPELAAAIAAARQGRPGLSAGNVVGSSTFNLLAVLGVAGLIEPLSVAPNAPGSLLWLTGLVVLVLVLFRSGHVLTRVEGTVLVLVALARWAVDLLGGA
ncbi:MAG: calcium/sodium antiporter [Haloarculaceae archaeon]